MLQKVTEYVCTQLTLVGVRAGNARVRKEKAFLISLVSPEAFLAHSGAGGASMVGLPFDRRILRFILSAQVSRTLHKPHLLRKGKGIIKKTVALNCSCFRPDVCP